VTPDRAPDRTPDRTIDIRSRLTFANSLRFPLQSAASRRDIIIGGLWLLVPVVGWLMNMGHRIRVVHRMHHGRPVWPAWSEPRELFGLLAGGIGFLFTSVWFWQVAAFSFATVFTQRFALDRRET